MYTIEHYGARFFAVYAAEILIAVTVYRRGAQAIIDALTQRDAQIAALQSSRV